MTEQRGSAGAIAAESRESQLPKWAQEHIATLKQSYLYLRISLVGVVFAIFAAVMATPVGYKAGGYFLRSISHYYYTPARIVFTGALCAAALALIAISGTGVQSRLLDLAALLAPLIAIIPTRTLASELGVEAGLGACVAGWTEKFKDCIPKDQLEYVELGLKVWAGFAIGGLVIALLQGVIRRVKEWWYWIVFVLGIATVVTYGVWWWSPWSEIDHEALQLHGHLFAAGTFFVIILVVAVLEALRQWFGDHTDKPKPAFWSRKIYAWIYAGIAVGFSIDIGVAWWVLARDDTIPDGNAVFWIEVFGLVFFALFWGAQTLEHCRDSEGWENPPKPREWKSAKARSDSSPQSVKLST